MMVKLLWFATVVVFIVSCSANERSIRAIGSVQKNVEDFKGYNYPVPSEAFTLPPISRPQSVIQQSTRTPFSSINTVQSKPQSALQNIVYENSNADRPIQDLQAYKPSFPSQHELSTLQKNDYSIYQSAGRPASSFNYPKPLNIQPPKTSVFPVKPPVITYNPKIPQQSSPSGQLPTGYNYPKPPVVQPPKTSVFTVKPPVTTYTPKIPQQSLPSGQSPEGYNYPKPAVVQPPKTSVFTVKPPVTTYSPKIPQQSLLLGQSSAGYNYPKPQIVQPPKTSVFTVKPPVNTYTPKIPQQSSPSGQSSAGYNYPKPSSPQVVQQSIRPVSIVKPKVVTYAPTNPKRPTHSGQSPAGYNYPKPTTSQLVTPKPQIFTPTPKVSTITQSPRIPSPTLPSTKYPTSKPQPKPDYNSSPPVLPSSGYDYRKPDKQFTLPILKPTTLPNQISSSRPFELYSTPKSTVRTTSYKPTPPIYIGPPSSVPNPTKKFPSSKGPQQSISYIPPLTSRTESPRQYTTQPFLPNQNIAKRPTQAPTQSRRPIEYIPPITTTQGQIISTPNRKPTPAPIQTSAQPIKISTFGTPQPYIPPFSPKQSTTKLPNRGTTLLLETTTRTPLTSPTSKSYIPPFSSTVRSTTRRPVTETSSVPTQSFSYIPPPTTIQNRKTPPSTTLRTASYLPPNLTNPPPYSSTKHPLINTSTHATYPTPKVTYPSIPVTTKRPNLPSKPNNAKPQPYLPPAVSTKPNLPPFDVTTKKSSSTYKPFYTTSIPIESTYTSESSHKIFSTKPPGYLPPSTPRITRVTVTAPPPPSPKYSPTIRTSSYPPPTGQPGPFPTLPPSTVKPTEGYNYPIPDIPFL